MTFSQVVIWFVFTDLQLP